MIQQGNQYPLPIKIISNNQPITPTDVDDVRIQVGDYLYSYQDGGLTFNIETNEWIFPLTEQMTQSFTNLRTPVQVGIKKNDRFIYSAIQNVDVGKSIIKETWE